MIAVFIVMLLTAGQPSKGARMGLADLDLEGWDLAGSDVGGSLTFTHPALGDQIPGFPQVWIRTEPLGSAPASSTLQLVELDCAARRARLRESYSYPLKNLMGAKRQLFLGKKPWLPLPARAWSKPAFADACEQ